MIKPKFDFKDVFTKEVLVKTHGQTFKVKIKGVVSAIEAKPTSEGFEYVYYLRSDFPSAYNEGHSVDQLYENKLEKEWQKVE